ncbi:metallo-beta-lactamase superfamily protein [Basidiobolus meristosporus CBS 931.73]|uniref:Metallo-beta-lactamase superfamily protein n=1 Tax=Basidiobolus meristosporus CBS 931.73 TaxID=1314790 RepID=A0A1Y1Y5Q8_9FUNG|nr:metallo-beta-lactamase superfamily protein [Basidiobolus meristosporus CBS 931.73]|eukprot:ORX93360.1 metallo-beta-lactamase superfamily protein [Basidiobolus meristosporus CBS 931.73]
MSEHTLPIEVDSLEITVVVDNETDGMSSTPEGLVLGQFDRLFRDHRHPCSSKGADCHEFRFPDACCAAHGLSLLITAKSGGTVRQVLFDTGPYEEIFQKNARNLKVDFSTINTVVLSHWHIDHSGGLLSVARECAKANNSVNIDLHPDRPDGRGTQLGQDEYVAWTADPSMEALEGFGAKLTKSSQIHTICEDMFLVSGEIPRLTSYELGVPSHVRWYEEAKTWKSDPLIMDERFLAVNVKGKGIILFTGCSHAGVINACHEAKRIFGPSVPLYMVIGGFHLAGRQVEQRIQNTVQDMAAFNPTFLAPGHCTGWRAKMALERAFPERLVPSAVGNIFKVSSDN